MRKRSTFLFVVSFVASSIVLFQNFTPYHHETAEKIVIPDVAVEAPAVQSICRPDEQQVVLVRIKGFRAGLRADIIWKDSKNGQVIGDNVTLPFAFGNCTTPAYPNEFKFCPGQLSNYVDLQIITEEGETANLSAPVGSGCESDPFVIETYLQGGAQ
jgi:hypothetical protein